jgi:glycosyltransferase involved in cell wall biosynthesis
VKAHGFSFHLRRLITLCVTNEKRAYDVFLARGYRFPALHVLARRLLGYRVVYEIHELNAFHDAVDGDVLAPGRAVDLERHAFRRADGIISISRTLLDVAIRKWGAPRASVVIASGGERFETAALAAGRSPRHVYYVGNIYPLSGVEHVVEAIATLPEATLTIVGSTGRGRNHDRLVARIADLGVGDRVTVRAFVDPSRLPEIYGEADILVAPYARTLRTEYFCSPLKIFEYMNARRPIVASDLPTIREILTDGENALLVQPESPGAIRDALARLMQDATLARRLAERAHADAEPYTLERKCGAILDFLETIVGASRSRAA